MEGWLGAAYLWVKAGHVVFVIFWMAGLFAIGRYLVHHRACDPAGAEHAAWSGRTATLRRVVLNPSMMIAWVLGLALTLNYGLTGPGVGWLHLKLVLMVVLTGYHVWTTRTARRLAEGARPYGDRQLRLLNEVPALFIVAAVVLAVVKPF